MLRSRSSATAAALATPTTTPTITTTTTTTTTTTEAATEASPLLSFPCPYPVPKVHIVEIIKPNNGQSIGISFAWQGRETIDPVIIRDIQSTSLLYRTALDIGQILIAINNVKVTSSKHAIQIIQQQLPLSILQFISHDPMQSKYFKMIVGSTTSNGSSNSSSSTHSTDLSSTSTNQTTAIVNPLSMNGGTCTNCSSLLMDPFAHPPTATASTTTSATHDDLPIHSTIIVVPEHPGIHVRSCREGTLLRVARIFQRGIFGKSTMSDLFQVDDIVLAINGIVVDSPMIAKHILRQGYSNSNSSTSSSRSCIPFIFMYALDMKILRQAIIDDTLNSNPTIFKSVLVQQEIDTRFCYFLIPDQQQGTKRQNQQQNYNNAHKPIAQLTFHIETLHMEDPQEHLHMVVRPTMHQMDLHGSTPCYDGASLCFQGRYGSLVRPLIREFNDTLEGYLGILEEFVCQQGWKDCTNIRMMASNTIPPTTTTNNSTPSTNVNDHRGTVSLSSSPLHAEPVYWATSEHDSNNMDSIPIAEIHPM